MLGCDRPRQRPLQGFSRSRIGFCRFWICGGKVSVGTHPPQTTSPFATIEEAIEDIRSGRFVVVVDDADRENEGDLTVAAQFVTPEAINFMATHARGLICLCLSPDRCDELELRPMTDRNETPLGTAFTVSIEAREGVSTGISAHDRAQTIQVAIDPRSKPSDLVHPGHVFPLRAKPGGVLQRAGQTEAAVDLARLAGLNPAGVVCEIMNEDGTMARVPDLAVFCERHALKMVTVADLIEYRRRTEKLVERVVSVRLPTEYGEFQAIAYREVLSGKQHLALVKGELEGVEHVLVRVHSECLTGDVFHSLLCDCGEQLEQALAHIEAEGRGVVLYMAQEGRGIGLLNKLKAYELQQSGLDTVEANLELGFPPDVREWGIGNQILADLGLTTIRILTNNPQKLTGLDGYGLAVVEQVPIEVEPNAENARYLATKREKLGHTLGPSPGPLLGPSPPAKLHHQGARLDPEARSEDDA
jgi:3,4-dihydroxy 2-butanone 4-phosphate synthase/GTP cyclohydrolase II